MAKPRRRNQRPQATTRRYVMRRDYPELRAERRETIAWEARQDQAQQIRRRAARRARNAQPQPAADERETRHHTAASQREASNRDAYDL